MVEGERELRRVSMTRLGCLVAYPKSGKILKVRPNTHHSSRYNGCKSKFLCTNAVTVYTQGLTQVMITVLGPREAKSHCQTICKRAISDVEVNIAPFNTVNAESGEGTTTYKYIQSVVFSLHWTVY